MNSRSALNETTDKFNLIFFSIYQSAKALDEEALVTILEAGACINCMLDGDTSPVSLLAQQGEYKAVEFLIDKFQASRNHALYGYARSGYVEQANLQIAQGANRGYAVLGYARANNITQVNDQIANGASRDVAAQGYAEAENIEQANLQIAQGAGRENAVLGYARANNITQVNVQIANGADRDNAVQGYAEAGNIDQVNSLINQGAGSNLAVLGYAKTNNTEQTSNQLAQGASRNFALWGYAEAGNIDQVNSLINQGAESKYAIAGYAMAGNIKQVNQLIELGGDKKPAVIGYQGGRYLGDQKNTLWLMTFTDNEDLRKLLAIKANEINKSINIEKLYEKVRKIKGVMDTFQLQNFNQALVLSNQNEGTRRWFLQRSIFVNKIYADGTLVENSLSKLPLEIIYYITSFIVGCSLKDSENIISAVNRKLFEGVTDIFCNNYSTGLFSRETYIKKEEQAEERYQRRNCF